MIEDHKTLSFYNLRSGSKIVVEKRDAWLEMLFIFKINLQYSLNEIH
jgi:hypothetical protein